MKAFRVCQSDEREGSRRRARAEPEKALPIGGGQDLLARMKDYVTQPDRIVNVKAALDATVTRAGGGLKIGAAMTMVDLAEHAEVARLYPAIAAAAIEVGTPQIRNQGTVGGNLNQRPRCWYYRNEECVCFKKGGNTCFSRGGENQFHAILGGGPSFIVHPSSLAVPLVARRDIPPGRADGRADGPGGRLLHDADAAERPHGERARAQRAVDPRHPARARHGQERPLRSALQDVARLADRVRHGAADDERRDREVGARRHGRGRADSLALQAAERRWPESRSTRRRPPRRPRRRSGRPGRSARTPTRCKSRRPRSSAPSCAPPASRPSEPGATDGIVDLAEDHRGRALPEAPDQEHVHAAVVDPDEATFYDRYATSAYWCAMTQTGFGPDGEPVQPDPCRGHAAAAGSEGPDCHGRKSKEPKEIAYDPAGSFRGINRIRRGHAHRPRTATVKGTYVEARTRKSSPAPAS